MKSILNQILPAIDPKIFATRGPIKPSGESGLNEAYSSAYFAQMIYVYKREKRLDKIAELNDRCLATAEKFQPATNGTQPIEML